MEGLTKIKRSKTPSPPPSKKKLFVMLAHEVLQSRIPMQMRLNALIRQFLE
jgi:hypothetical protein